MSLLKEITQNILINAEYNQSEAKNVHCTAPEKKKKVIINEYLYILIWSITANYKKYSKRMIPFS